MEPKLHSLIGERFEESTALTAHEARCDVSDSGFWSVGQVAFLDITVSTLAPDMQTKDSANEVN